MAKAMVKCFYCGQSFDRNSEPFAKPKGNRYAHIACHEKAQANKTKEERDYEELIEYIKHLLGNTLNPRVWKQLKEYGEAKDDQGKNMYSYSGIHKTLQWWYELKGNPIEKANGGIGIVPYVYDQACQYYYALYLAALSNADKDVAQCVTKVREFIISPPVIERRQPRLFNLDYEEGEEE